MESSASRLTLTTDTRLARCRFFSAAVHGAPSPAGRVYLMDETASSPESPGED